MSDGGGLRLSTKQQRDVKTAAARVFTSGSQDVSGATTRNGIPKWAAAIASCRVPILFAVSPLAATLSAPTATASTFPGRRAREGRGGEGEIVLGACSESLWCLRERELLSMANVSRETTSTTSATTKDGGGRYRKSSFFTGDYETQKGTYSREMRPQEIPHARQTTNCCERMTEHGRPTRPGKQCNNQNIPWAIRNEAAESGMSVPGSPSATNSYAVRRAPF